MVISLEITRLSDDGKETLGEFNVIGYPFSGKTLELPYKDNKHRISCIPKGVYIVVKRVNEKHGNHFHITNVPNRDYILIHSANYAKELLGCIAIGASTMDINKDGVMDITSSRVTLATLFEIMPDKFKLTIK